MIKIKRLGMVVIVFLLLLNILAPATWAQANTPTPERASTAQWVAAVFADILYVPITGLFLCPVSGGLWATTLVLSGGTAYNVATDVVRGGCGGKWVVKGGDIHSASRAAAGAER